MHWHELTVSDEVVAIAIFYNLSIDEWTSHMHACQSAIARSFPIPNPCNVMKLYLVYNNMLKGILHKECATFTLGLKTRHSKYYTLYYMTIYKQFQTYPPPGQNQHYFKGMLPGLKLQNYYI